jgi:4-hydroxybenzoyl-CoA thioesterase
MIYRRPIQIEFNHCDPAGIVFYPRYFEMTNSVAENFFREVVGESYATMIARAEGTPTVTLTAEFLLPSRLGEVLEWRLTVEAVGRSSMDLLLIASCGGQDRLRVKKRLVYAGLRDGQPAALPWPAALRERLMAVQAAPDI